MAILNRYPEDDDETIYLPFTTTLSEIIAKAQAKWGPLSLDEISVRAEHIHTRCIGYDLYDGGDYDDYIIVERNAF